MDVTTCMIDPPEQSGVITLGNAVPPASLDELVTLLRSAARPLILAGSGVRGGTVPASLRVVAERLGCPVATTPKGKGVFPESHPLSLGVFGLGGHPSARAYVDANPDLVFVIGSSLGDLSTDGFSPQLQAPTLIHVDIDGRQLGKSYAPTHGIVAGAAEVLGGLEARLAPVDVVAPLGGVVRHELPPSAGERIAPHDAIVEIQRLLPADTIYTVDSGEHFLFATHFLAIDHPDAYVVMTGLGSMGQSIGGAIGAQLAHPTRTVATIVGDGCFAMNAFEVATAATEKLPLRVFVFNDARLGMVEIGHEAVYGRKPDYATNPLDVCAVASGLGAATVRVTSVEELRAAAPLLRDHPGPVVVDVCIDPDVKLPKKDRMGAFAPKLSPARTSPRLVN
jgi:acetolactate synthase-1/2/3 large subunit